MQSSQGTMRVPWAPSNLVLVPLQAISSSLALSLMLKDGDLGAGGGTGKCGGSALPNTVMI